jgi:hypothetical protein
VVLGLLGPAAAVRRAALLVRRAARCFGLAASPLACPSAGLPAGSLSVWVWVACCPSALAVCPAFRAALGVRFGL